ncbi:hypothetical protein GH714_001995 [Hevea brasiliensis]|uniref:Pentacotripeptide-repeat region of PRORP domain-containing protein n=1 Tax=Hevea brasiliensis TaxID=3981 RepID=A0A6A6MYH7_HEVBR|nr:hypothetical protein GH714_001995 [Hevea brasiliensis]
MEGDNEKALLLLDTMLGMDVNPTKIMYSKVIGALCWAGEMKKAQRVLMVNRMREACHLLGDMKSRGIKPDVITYTVLIDNCSKANWKMSHSRPDGMESEGNKMDPLVFWSEMKDMDIKPDVVCYTVLIDKHCKTNNIQEAIMLFDEMIDRGLEPDTVTYTALLSGHCNVGDVEKAEVLIDEMIHKEIQPDAHTMSVLQRSVLKARKVHFRQ